MGLSGWLLGGAVSLGAAVLFVPRELWRRWRERLVDRLDRTLRRRVSRFGRRYREFVTSGLRFIDLKGLATVGFHTPELDEVFIDVSLDYRAPHQVPAGLLDHPPAGETGRRSIGDFLDREQPAVLAVIGGPGSGKTTLLRHTARTVCREHEERRRAVPVLLYLRDHIAEIVATPAVPLPTLIRGTLGRHAADEPPGWFEQRLAAGDCVVLLDGLDEVATQGDRRRVADWIERLTEQYPANDYVITSRPQGYRAAAITGATVLQVRSFTDEQVTTFVRGWYRAVAQRVPAAGDAADDLLRRLDRTPGLSALTVNPLLLTMIANVHHYRGALPGSRAELYGEICQVILWRRQDAKKLPSELSGDRKELLLRGLAFTMMQRRVRDLPRHEVLAEFRSALRRMSTTVDEERFLDEVCAYGLVIERESGQYAFAHLSFQESLAASHIRAKNLVDVLIKTVDDSWWRETILLYATQSDADLIVEACLDAGTANALSLALDCADQSGDLAPELRVRLDELVAHTDVSLWAAVQVNRHFREVIRTTDGGRVCARPVTAAIYELFRNATGTAAPDGPPTDPVTGVRASDADAFVRWANEIVEEPKYRLPTVKEVADPAVGRTIPTPNLYPWSTVEGAVVLWTAPGVAHPNHVDAETFAQHVGDDLERLKPALARMLLARLIPAVDALTYEADLPTFPGWAELRLAQVRLAQHLTRDEVRTEALDGDDREMALMLGLDESIALDVEAIRGIVATLERELSAGASASRAFPARVLKDMPKSVVSVTGNVSARALSDPLNAAFHSDRPVDWKRVFRTKFNALARVADCAGVVSLDELPDHLRAGERAISNAKLRPWHNSVIHRLMNDALPVFERRRPLTPVTASAIRLAALCLAVEADTHCPEPAGNHFRAVATGITLLERRATGQALATEAVVLATE
ncbi:NACHT domain-containing NTPase [Kibdelosporangium aridum]|nr:NACHT domain-containing protein [Kibdelosporangium aridum]